MSHTAVIVCYVSGLPMETFGVLSAPHQDPGSRFGGAPRWRSLWLGRQGDGSHMRQAPGGDDVNERV